MRSPTLLFLLSLWSTSLRHDIALAQSSEAHLEDVPPLVLPSLKPLPGYSFRGPISENSKIDGFEVTGQATRLPTSPDFLRLLQPIPLSHGAIFTNKRIDSKEWIVEIAMRVHGSMRPGGTKGGRGLGFWYTKTGSPATVSSSSKESSAAKDSLVSFFGQSTNFDGLGIVLDSAPSAPLLARSNVDGWTFGADSTGVISAIIDDGTTGNGYYDTFKKGQRREPGQEAKYLEKVVGECEAAFRNAPGLVWVRIAHFDKMIRVDLDLQPHTTLSDEQRHFSHHCLTVKDVSLPSGYHFGLSALASGNTEPDSVDIYAFDAWEVVGKAGANDDKQIPPPVVELSEARKSQPLAGTVVDRDDPTSMLAEIIATQARMTQAIDALARRIDQIAGSIGTSGSSSNANNAPIDTSAMSGQLTSIQASLSALTGKRSSSSNGAAMTAEEIEQQSVQYIVGQLNRLSADVKAANVRFDNFSMRVNKSIGTITNRIGEVFTITSRYINERQASKSVMGNMKSIGQVLVWILGAAGVGVLGMAADKWRRSRQDGGGGRGKKMI